MDLVETIRGFVEEALEDPQYFVVDIQRRADGRMITVMLDGDEGIPIAECSRVNRRISSRIDEEVPDEVGAFIVEVSSPGVDKPLMLLRQLPKHIGRRIEFVDDLGVKQEGTFKELKDEVLVLEQAYKEKGKKQQILLNEYNWKQLHDPKVVVTFKR